MKSQDFALMIMRETLTDMHKKFNNPDIRMRTRPAKPSELLALQKRINKPRGHYYLMQEHHG